jgi:hypothetical protein
MKLNLAVEQNFSLPTTLKTVYQEVKKEVGVTHGRTPRPLRVSRII